MGNLLPQLNKKYLKTKLLGTELADFPEEIMRYPERVLQIGEGNFLRAFVDWMFQQMNKEGVFKGRAVVIQPIPAGRTNNLKEQDNLYTLLLRGREEGEIVDKREIITTISRGLESYTQWKEVLKLAKNSEIEFVVSNTTEAGITYRPEDNLDDSPPESFPGKLTAFLYHRFQHFAGAKDKGMIIVPVELIDRNGDNLRRIIIQLADDWNLSPEFITWVKEANYFLNTLVDRIVTGYPVEETDKLETELGYRDQNLDTGEIFHLWIIEGPEKLKERLPFHKVGLNVKWVDDLTPYRTRKVRILNGAHTSTVPVSYLAGIELVRDAVNDKLVGEFIKQVIFKDILPTLDSDREELEKFAGHILERFNNPFIDHRWLDISLNSTSKYKTRVLPSLLKYIEKYGELPERIVFSLASLIVFYRGTEIQDNKLIAGIEEKYLVEDDRAALEFFSTIWSAYEKEEIELKELVKKVLAHNEFWEQNLNKQPGLTDGVNQYLKQILDKGMRTSLKKLLT